MSSIVQNIPKLRFPRFSREWEQRHLGDYFEFKNGVNADKSAYGRGHKFINVLDIIADGAIYHDKIIGSVEISDAEFQKNEVKYGDVLFQRSSETREEVGQSNVYLDKTKSATFGGFVIRGRSKATINPEFFNNLLKTSAVRRDMTARSGGSTRFNVGQVSLSKVEVVISVDPDEQQKIARFLGSVDEKISQLTCKKTLLEDYKKGCMQKLFSQEMRFKDDQGNDFPDWAEKRLREVLVPNRRERDKPSGSYLAIGVRSHMKGTFQKPNFDPAKIAMEKLFMVQENDLIVNITFAWEGAIALVKAEDEGGYVSHRFPTYGCISNALLPSYLRQVILNKRFKYQLDLISPGGAGRNRVLSKNDFLKIKWLFPPIKEQQKIADFLTAIDKKIELVSTEIEHAKAFKKGLLQQMFI